MIIMKGILDILTCHGSDIGSGSGTNDDSTVTKLVIANFSIKSKASLFGSGIDA
jgi:hypothetical protein